MGNKLVEGAKAQTAMLKNKLKFVIKSLSDNDAKFVLAAYNQLKQRCQMLNGVGLADAQMKKVNLIKRMMNKTHNLQVMALHSIKEFLKSERDYEQRLREEYE